ncbi:hypothetical protein [Arenimonas fontis]|uniref:Uncharacterized protein n=1 Tax=Arenimonas fontis TaxID=2608255 RepID=A0A5B2ZD37_9GAMM|nr:hypothetical protein [Arenimonas fontis]KAA2285104.1 hypothetical protein F0415_07630 [Arenimonas fontis]
MKRAVPMSLVLGLAACGGEAGGGAGKGPGAVAAEACRAAAEARLDGKLYQLDLAALAASMREASNGEKFLTAPIVIEPGLTSETRQIVECTVRFTGERADVVGFVFNW